MKKSLHIYLEPKIIEQLKILAAKKTVRVNEIITQAIQKKLAEEENHEVF
jgi:predicted HicB family RNase H-like nuclease